MFHVIHASLLLLHLLILAIFFPAFVGILLLSWHITNIHKASVNGMTFILGINKIINLKDLYIVVVMIKVMLYLLTS